MKKLLLVLAGLLVVLGIGAFFLYRSKAAALEDVFTSDVAAERARVAALRRPPLRGEARAVNGADELRAAIEAIEKVGPAPLAPKPAAGATVVGPGTLRDVAEAPAAAPPAWLEPYIEKGAPALAAVREAIRAERCDWSTRYEDGFSAWVPKLIEVRNLGGLLVVEGHRRAVAGDAAGAAEAYLDATRLGFDVGAPGSSLIAGAISANVAGTALVALGWLIEARGLSPEALQRVERELAVLDGLVPGAADSMRSERLGTLGGCRKLVLGESDGGLFESVTRARFVGAFCWEGYDRIARDLEAAARLPPAERSRRLGEINDAAAQGNTLVRIAVPNLGELVPGLDVPRARIAVLRAAAAVARAHATAGAFPAAVGDLGAPVPTDPFAAAPIRYERAADGGSAKVWSVGRDLKDDGGKPLDGKDKRSGDIVIEMRGR